MCCEGQLDQNMRRWREGDGGWRERRCEKEKSGTSAPCREREKERRDWRGGGVGEKKKGGEEDRKQWQIIESQQTTTERINNNKSFGWSTTILSRTAGVLSLVGPW